MLIETTRGCTSSSVRPSPTEFFFPADKPAEKYCSLIFYERKTLLGGWLNLAYKLKRTCPYLLSKILPPSLKACIYRVDLSQKI